MDEGDIIDYAYWQRDPEGGRVIWIHNMDGENVLTADFDSAAVEDDEFLDQLALAVFGRGPVVAEQVEALREAGSDAVLMEDGSPESLEASLDRRIWSSSI